MIAPKAPYEKELRIEAMGQVEKGWLEGSHFFGRGPRVVDPAFGFGEPPARGHLRLPVRGGAILQLQVRGHCAVAIRICQGGETDTCLAMAKADHRAAYKQLPSMCRHYRPAAVPFFGSTVSEGERIYSSDSAICRCSCGFLL